MRVPTVKDTVFVGDVKVSPTHKVTFFPADGGEGLCIGSIAELYQAVHEGLARIAELESELSKLEEASAW